MISRFESGTPEEWIIFVALVLKALEGQNTQQTDLVGSCAVGNFSIAMITMTVHIFPALAYQDQKWYM